MPNNITLQSLRRTAEGGLEATGRPVSVEVEVTEASGRRRLEFLDGTPWAAVPAGPNQDLLIRSSDSPETVWAVTGIEYAMGNHVLYLAPVGPA